MEVLRDLRPLGRLTLLLAAVVLVAAPLEAQRRGRGAPAAAPAPQWPVKTREHVDLWLHAFALLQDDTATVPFFARGYRERVTVAKNARGLYTAFDTARDELARTGASHLLSAQFLALYFGSWEEMQQAVDYFLKADGDPRRASNQEVQGIVAFLNAQFPRPADRAWIKRLMETLADERTQFHRGWWLEQSRARDRALAVADSLWQREWRPALQRYLNYTQQAGGDLILSLALGGEGRAVSGGRRASQFAVAFPATADSAEVLLFSFVHEAAGVIAKVAVDDNLTPAQQRAGLGAQYGSAGLVRGGALLAEQVAAGMGERYARWYLAQAGRPVADGRTALAALAELFPMPPEMITSLERQIALSFQGI
jgi:hypothetical protein